MTEDERHELLAFVRATIQAQLSGKPLPPAPVIAPQHDAAGGVFVTLHNHGRLRGCIGQFGLDDGLTATLQRVALSALRDPRFVSHPIVWQEIPNLRIEISVLSQMKRTNDPLSLEIGTHGIYIRRGTASAVFLPQVATEQGWGKEEFLSRCCQTKGGLPPDAWRDPATEVYLFTAEVFGEAD